MQISNTEITVMAKKCCGCAYCYLICPSNAINMYYNKIIIEKSLCTMCKKCFYVCPKDAIKISSFVLFNNKDYEVQE